MLALQAKPPAPKKPAPKKKSKAKPKRRVIDFYRLVLSVADRFGATAAAEWTKAVLGYQAQINETSLRSAIASGHIAAIEAVVGPTKLQTALSKVLVGPLMSAVQAVGKESLRVLASKGIEASFNAMHPNIVAFAREKAAELVAGVPKETKQIIAEVIARGAERGLTVAQQARAIREVVGLPPNWMDAPQALAAELRNGEISAATGRKMSAVLKQQIRSASANDTMTEAFIKKATAEYSATLVNARAMTIARTETIRAANYGLQESWDQAVDQGALPSTSRQFWIVTPDDRLCPICSAIPDMNPNGRELGESFMTPEGPVDAPPAPHPNCRCSIGLGFGP
jgi:hypothetical protein